MKNSDLESVHKELEKKSSNCGENSKITGNIIMESDEAKKNNLKTAKLAFQKLKTEWSKRPSNLEVCGQLLVELKVSFVIYLIPRCKVNILNVGNNFQVLLLELQFLPTNIDASEEELMLASKFAQLILEVLHTQVMKF